MNSQKMDVITIVTILCSGWLGLIFYLLYINTEGEDAFGIGFGFALFAYQASLLFFVPYTIYGLNAMRQHWNDTVVAKITTVLLYVNSAVMLLSILELYGYISIFS